MKRILCLGLFLCLFMAAAPSAASAAPVLPVYRESVPLNICVLSEQRDDKFHDLLRVSVKILVSGNAGSGTICHYDESTGWAYVVSCGHLWSGNKKYSPSTIGKAKIIAWYHEEQRLDNPQHYDSEVLFWSNDRGRDVSLLRFKPDWPCSYAPISVDRPVAVGSRLNSMGCDGGNEVARYEVVVQSSGGEDLTTKLNSPRPGRSGGGLITDDGIVVGVCWGTSDISSGDGTGFFTPAKAIRDVFEANGHSWLLAVIWPASSIPVVDHQSPDKKYSRHYIPIPLN